MADQIIKVMVVEDEPVILHNTIKKIEKADSCFKVTSSALNGKEALSKIRFFKPDVLFTDIRMPVLDGIELIKRIRVDFPDIPVVVLSGYNEFEYAQQAIRLGVKEYLLKPLDQEQLVQTLNNIKNSLLSNYKSLELSILSSEINGQNTEEIPPSQLRDSRFSMFLICIGHLCSNLLSINNAQLFSGLWSQIDWNKIIVKLPADIQNWWLVDEKMSNQKFLIISSPNITLNEIQNTARVLQDTLTGYIHPFPLNISTDYGSFPYMEIWKMAQKLRSRLEKGLIMGNSKIIADAENTSAENPGKLIPSKLENSILSLSSSQNIELLNQVIIKLLESWEECKYPQRSVEKALFHLFNLFQKSSINPIESHITDLEASVHEKIAVSTDFKSLYGFIQDSIQEVFLSEEQKKEYTSELADSIEQYFILNYMNDVSLEDLARKYNFTSAYLTKIFKKYKNESPLKYLIKLRIVEAKRLISGHPELDMKTIAEMVGYDDQHYFSKVFKNITGRTPSEFRVDNSQ